MKGFRILRFLLTRKKTIEMFLQQPVVYTVVIHCYSLSGNSHMTLLAITFVRICVDPVKLPPWFI